MPVLSSRFSAFAFFVLLFSVSFLSVPGVSWAADITLSPATGSVSVGQKITLKVNLDPSGESVNAADGTLSFDPALLAVDSVSKDGSIFSLWTADPTFSNQDGTVTFSGGTPTAFTTPGKVLTVVFKAKAVGSPEVSVSKGSVLAADGKGTDVYKSGVSAKLTVTAATAPPPAPEPTPAPAADTSADASTGDGSPPVAPVISSPQFTKPDSWAGTSTITFNWVLTSDVTAVRTLISDKDAQTPKTTLKGGATTTQTVVVPKDGVSYFYVQGKNEYGWGDVAQIKIQVDTAPPSAFEIAVQESGSDGGPPKLTFKTDDVLSGMDHYILIVGTSTPISISLKDISDGTYPIPPQGGGVQHVVVRAYDKAGNITEVVKDLTLPAVAKPKAAAAVDETPPAPTSSGFGMEGILLVALALILGGVFAYDMYYRKTTRR
jgi:hypothetical protein